MIVLPYKFQVVCPPNFSSKWGNCVFRKVLQVRSASLTILELQQTFGDNLLENSLESCVE